MKVFGLFGLLIITVVFITSNAKRLPMEDDDDDLELADVDARSFLKKHKGYRFDKHVNNLDCVLCKFNLVPCCKPNICVKKSFRPDECLELKPR
jgi:hypothetical protein